MGLTDALHRSLVEQRIPHSCYYFPECRRLGIGGHLGESCPCEECRRVEPDDANR